MPKWASDIGSPSQFKGLIYRAVMAVVERLLFRKAMNEPCLKRYSYGTWGFVVFEIAVALFLIGAAVMCLPQILAAKSPWLLVLMGFSVAVFVWLIFWDFLPYRKTKLVLTPTHLELSGAWMAKKRDGKLDTSCRKGDGNKHLSVIWPNVYDLGLDGQLLIVKTSDRKYYVLDIRGLNEIAKWRTLAYWQKYSGRAKPLPSE